MKIIENMVLFQLIETLQIASINGGAIQKQFNKVI